MHVAIIMDGNGRWAQQRGLPRWKGHQEGVESLRTVVRAAPSHGIRILTLYAFSSDNWKRPITEVRKLFQLLRDYCSRERQELQARDIRITAIGRRDRIPRPVIRELERLENATSHCQTLHLRLALDYSSRAMITSAARELVARAVRNGADPSVVDPDELHTLITTGVKDPDLLIRTAGERRLSDFLLWELSYAELHFTDTPWPDFREHELGLAIRDFQTRERRFGGVAPGRRRDQQRSRLVG